MSELEKWSKVHESARAINEFFDYLNENKLLVGGITDNGMFLVPNKTRDEMIFECYNINANKLEQERREILELARQNSTKVKP